MGKWRRPKIFGLRFWRKPGIALPRGVHCWIGPCGFFLIQRTRLFHTTHSYHAVWRSRERTLRMAQVLGGVLSMRAKRLKKAEQGERAPHAAYDDLVEQFPAIAEFMAGSQFDDGKPRVGGWVGVSCRGGSWEALVKNNAEGQELVLAAPTATLLLALVEGSLLDPNAPWRPILGWQDPAAPRKRRR